MYVFLLAYKWSKFFICKSWKWKRFTVNRQFKGPADFWVLKLWCWSIPTQTFYPQIWQTHKFLETGSPSCFSTIQGYKVKKIRAILLVSVNYLQAFLNEIYLTMKYFAPRRAISLGSWSHWEFSNNWKWLSCVPWNYISSTRVFNAAVALSLECPENVETCSSSDTSSMVCLFHNEWMCQHYIFFSQFYKNKIILTD